MLKKYFVFLVVLVISCTVRADYEKNFDGKITQVLTYTHVDEILIRVEGQPTNHPVCTLFDYMVIDKSVSVERRQVVLSRILLAYASGEIVNIGYDSKDECIEGRIKVYRIG